MVDFRLGRRQDERPWPLARVLMSPPSCAPGPRVMRRPASGSSRSCISNYGGGRRRTATRTPESHVAGDSPRARGVHAARRSAPSYLAESGTVLCCRVANDAAHPRRPRQASKDGQAIGQVGASLTARCPSSVGKSGRRHFGVGYAARSVGRLRRAEEPRRRAAVFRRAYARRNVARDGRLPRNSRARMARGPRLAARAADPWILIVGGRSRHLSRHARP